MSWSCEDHATINSKHGNTETRHGGSRRGRQDEVNTTVASARSRRTRRSGCRHRSESPSCRSSGASQPPVNAAAAWSAEQQQTVAVAVVAIRACERKTRARGPQELGAIGWWTAKFFAVRIHSNDVDGASDVTSLTSASMKTEPLAAAAPPRESETRDGSSGSSASKLGGRRAGGYEVKRSRCGLE